MLFSVLEAYIVLLKSASTPEDLWLSRTAFSQQSMR